MVSIVPQKFIPYLISPNISLFTQLQSLITKNQKLTLAASIDWNESGLSPTEVLEFSGINILPVAAININKTFEKDVFLSKTTTTASFNDEANQNLSSNR